MRNETTPKFSKSAVLADIYEQCESRALDLLESEDSGHWSSEDDFRDSAGEDLNGNPLDTYYYETLARGPIEVVYDAVAEDLKELGSDWLVRDTMAESVDNGLIWAVNRLLNILAVYVAENEASAVWNSHLEDLEIKSVKEAA